MSKNDMLLAASYIGVFGKKCNLKQPQPFSPVAAAEAAPNCHPREKVIG